MLKSSHAVLAVALVTACKQPTAPDRVESTATFSIEEVLAANWNGLQDDNAEAPDWIEVLNRGTTPQSLAGWSLTDDAAVPRKWVFGAVTVPAKERLIVFASGKDRQAPGATLHTNFRISRRGEYLALVQPDGVVADAFEALPAAAPDQSVGRTEVRGPLVPLRWPTPGKPNAPAGSPTTPRVVEAQPPSGLYKAPQTVKLTCRVPGCVLRITTTATAAPLEVDGPVKVDRTTVLRVTASVRGQIVSDRIAFTYVFVDDVARQSGEGRRSHSGKVKLHYDVDQRLAATPAFERGLRALPSVFITTPSDGLLGPNGEVGRRAGRRYYRPAWVEMVAGSGDVVFSRRAAVGSHSHPIAKRSLRVTFEGRYGGGAVEAPIFSAEPTKLTRLLLRGGANDTFAGDLGDRATYVRDHWVRASQREMSAIGGRGRFVHLYLEGLYWGLYELVEHPGAEADAVGHPILRHRIERGLRASDPAAAQFLQKLRIAIGKSDVDELRAMIDFEGFADYLLLQWYAGVGDGLDNNWYAAVRPKPAGLRFFAWDAEYAFVDADPHPASHAGAWFPPAFRPGTPANDRYGRTTIVSLWRVLSKDPAFVKLLNARADHHLAGALSPELARRRWNEVTASIEDAIVAEAARWPGGSPEAWRKNVRAVDRILAGNDKRMRTALRDALR